MTNNNLILINHNTSEVKSFLLHNEANTPSGENEVQEIIYNYMTETFGNCDTLYTDELIADGEYFFDENNLSAFITSSEQFNGKY